MHSCVFFFFNDTATTEIYTLSLHDALPIYGAGGALAARRLCHERGIRDRDAAQRSEEHTSELQSRLHLVCRLLLEKKKKYLYMSTKSETLTSVSEHPILLCVRICLACWMYS